MLLPQCYLLGMCDKDSKNHLRVFSKQIGTRHSIIPLNIVGVGVLFMMIGEWSWLLCARQFHLLQIPQLLRQWQLRRQLISAMNKDFGALFWKECPIDCARSKARGALFWSRYGQPLEDSHARLNGIQLWITTHAWQEANEGAHCLPNWLYNSLFIEFGRERVL
ncbi:hypothetical protein SLA2020_430140 [Shorea laevis]